MKVNIKNLCKSIIQTIKIINYARLPTSMFSKQSPEYMSRRVYNSYLNMMRIKFKENTVKLKIRIPEGDLTLTMHDSRFEQIIRYMKMLNSEYVFSAPEYKGAYYIELNGIKLDGSAPAA